MTTTTHPDAAALLAAVRESPEDDGPRLVYADWLDENGQAERAVFIRTSIYKRLTYRFYKQADSKWSIIEEGPHGRHPIHRVAKAATGWLPDPDRLASNDGRAVWLPGIGFAYTGGFLAELRATTAAYMGGYCPSCDGVGDDGGRALQHTVCPACDGSGTMPGAWTVARDQPVTRVVLTDREPAPATSSKHPIRYAWAWYDPPTMPHHLPRELFRRLRRRKRDLNWIRYYPTRTSALAALSDAAVRYARLRNHKGD